MRLLKRNLIQSRSFYKDTAAMARATHPSFAIADYCNFRFPSIPVPRCQLLFQRVQHGEVRYRRLDELEW